MNKNSVSLGVLLISTFLLLLDTQIAVAGHEIVGTPRCKSCHKAKTGDQWQIWSDSAHARAFETLASEESRIIASGKGLGDPQQEESCLECHVTRLSLGDDVAINEKARYSDNEGVGCESCHGPGSDYKAKKIMKDPKAAREAGLLVIKTEDGCTQCHNEKSPTFKGFDFEDRWAEIAHPVPSGKQSQSALLAEGIDVPDHIAYTSSVGDVLFTHNQHVKEQEIECVECHHQIHAKNLETPHPDYMTSSWVSCKICHDENSDKNKKYYKCSDCHLSDPVNIADETLSSKVVIHENCWSCHETGTGVEASQGCAECHVKKVK